MDSLLGVSSGVSALDTMSTRLAAHKAAASLKNATANAKIDKAAKDFESIFVSQMLRPMFDGVEVDEVFGGGKGEEIMRSFMLDEYGKAMVANGGLKLGGAIREEIARKQGISLGRETSTVDILS